MTLDVPSTSARVRRRRELVTRALDVLRGWGYDEADVPLLAPWGELGEAIGERVASRLFRFADHTGRLQVLRGDITPVIAWQVVRSLESRSLPVRVAYANRVARVERAFASQRLETYAVGMELIGAPGASADLEVITVALDLVDALGIHGHELHLGDVRIARGVIDAIAPKADAATRLQTALERRDAAVVAELSADASAELRAAAVALCRVAPDATLFDRLEALDLPDVAAACAALRARFAELGRLVPDVPVVLDPTTFDDRGYYTGFRFRLVHPRMGEALGAGGRYDSLFGRLGRALPATGIGVYIERVVALAAALTPDDDAAPAAQFDASGVDPTEAVARARAARRNGQRVVVAHAAADGGDR